MPDNDELRDFADSAANRLYPAGSPVQYEPDGELDDYREDDPEIGADDGDEDADEEEQPEDAGAHGEEWSSGFDLAAFALTHEDELEDEGGRAVSAADWLAWAVDAHPAAWAQACANAGLPAGTAQPSHADLRALGRPTQTAVLGSAFRDMVAKDRAEGRHW